MIRILSSHIKHNRTLLFILSLGLFIRFLVMPWAMHADLLSMTWRAYLMAEHGSWSIPTNQYLAHLVYAGNLLFMKLLGFNLSSYFPESFGLQSGSLTASVGDWLVFNENKTIQSFLFFLKLPHLIADTAIFFTLYKVFKNKKNLLMILAVWWLNPINLYAFYIFSRHDVFTALAVLLAIIFTSNNKVWQSLLSVFAAFQIRVQPLLLAPVFIVSLWKQKNSWQSLIKPLLVSVAVIVLYYGVLKLLPFNSDVYYNLTGQASTQVQKQISAVGIPTRHAEQVQPLFFLLYGCIGAVFLFFVKKVAQEHHLAVLNAVLLMVMSVYFAVNDFFPHYFVWLSIYVTVALAYTPQLLKWYTLTAVGFLIMAVTATNEFAITQNLFMPISTSLFRTPNIATSLLARGVPITLVFTLGKVIVSLGCASMAVSVWRSTLQPHVQFSMKQFKKAFSLSILAVFLLLATPTYALTAPVLSTERGTEKLFLNIDQVITQSFISTAPTIGSVELRVFTDRVPRDTLLSFKIKEKSSPEWYYEAEYNTNDFYNKYYYPFGFPEITDALGKEYVFELQYKSNDTQKPLAVYTTGTIKQNLGTLLVNGVVVPENTLDFKVTSNNTSLFISQVKSEVTEKILLQKTFFTFYAFLLGTTLTACLCISLSIWQHRKYPC